MTAKRLGIIFKIYTVTLLRYKLDVIEQTSQLKQYIYFFNNETLELRCSKLLRTRFSKLCRACAEAKMVNC